MKRKTILLLMTAALTLCGCAETAQRTDSAAEASSVVEETEADTAQENSQDETAADSDLLTPVSDIDTNDQFTDRDQDSSWDAKSAVTVSFTDDGITVSGESAEVSGTTLTITKAGTYVLSGTCSDGQIVIACGDEDKVQLVLAGLTLTNDDGPCILAKSADKVFITLADGSENTLSDTGEAYTREEDVEQNLDGVIFSLCTLTFNGNGSLCVNAGYDHAIVSKDDVKFTGGTYEITAAGKGIAANDSIRILDGTFTITAEDDGLHTGNEDDDGKGYIYICGGSLTISSGDDGIHAATALYVTGGTIDVTKSYEGLEGDSIDITGGTIQVVSDDDGLNASTGSGQQMQGGMPQAGPGGGKAPDQTESETPTVTPTRMGGGGGQAEDDGSYIRISGGDIYINAEGDGIDSNGGTVYRRRYRHCRRSGRRGKRSARCRLGGRDHRRHRDRRRILRHGSDVLRLLDAVLGARLPRRYRKRRDRCHPLGLIRQRNPHLHAVKGYFVRCLLQCVSYRRHLHAELRG